MAFIQEATLIYPNGNVQTIDDAVVPSKPVSPNTNFNIMLAFILGLIVTIGWSFMNEYLDKSVKNEEDVNKYVGLPIMGIIPKGI